MYSSMNDKLTEFFSEDFSGFTGGGNFLVKDRQEWVAITRQDFAQVTDPIRIELKDVAIQSLSETIAVATSFFVIHLPIKDTYSRAKRHVLSSSSEMRSLDGKSPIAAFPSPTTWFKTAKSIR